MTIRVIDLETTGVDPAADRIVEIAACDIVRDIGLYNIANIRQDVVDPGIPIPPAASAVHHLIDADVQGCRTIREVLPPYLETDDNRLVFVAHNASFERDFLTPLMGDTAGNWICTYRCALRIWPDLPAHSNQFLRYHLGLTDPFGIPRAIIDPHRALSDCYITGAIFTELIKHAKFNDLLHWSTEPPLHTTLNFGKHKGQRYDAAPSEYLDWLANKADQIRPDVKWSATYWLNQKTKAA